MDFNKLLEIIKKHKYKILMVILVVLDLIRISNIYNRDYNYKKLIKKATEVNDNYFLSCYEKEYKEQNSPIAIECTVKINSEKTRKENVNGFLEYFILDYKNTDKLQLKSAWVTSLHTNAPDYYVITRSNNRIIVENKDKEVSKELFYESYNMDKEYKEFSLRKCDKNSFVCKDSLEDFILHLEFDLLDANDSKLVIDNIEKIYSYACEYNPPYYKKICVNEKASNIKEEIDLKQVNIIGADTKELENIFSDKLSEKISNMERTIPNILDDFENRIIITNNEIGCQGIFNNNSMCKVSFDYYKSAYYDTFGDNYSFEGSYLTRSLDLINNCEKYTEDRDYGDVCFLRRSDNNTSNITIEKHTYYKGIESLVGKFDNSKNNVKGTFYLEYEVKNSKKYLKSIFINKE